MGRGRRRGLLGAGRDGSLAVALTLSLGGGCQPALAPADDAAFIDLGESRFDVVFSDDGLLGSTDQQSTGGFDSRGFCTGFVQNTRLSAFAVTDTGAGVCASGASFDRAGRLVVRSDAALAAATLAGPWTTFTLAENARCGTTTLADGTWVTCDGTALIGLSPAGPLTFRVAVDGGRGGTVVGRPIAGDDDTVSVIVLDPEDPADPTAPRAAHLVGVRAGAVVFDVAITPVGAPSLDDDGHILVPTIDGDVAGLTVIDGADGTTLSTIPLPAPAAEVLVDDGELLVIEARRETAPPSLRRLDGSGAERWSLSAPGASGAAIDDDGHIWVNVEGAVVVLTRDGDELTRFTPWGTSPTGAPNLADGWYAGTWDGVAGAIRLGDPDVQIARRGWPRPGGSHRADGRRAAP